MCSLTHCFSESVLIKVTCKDVKLRSAFDPSSTEVAVGSSVPCQGINGPSNPESPSLNTDYQARRHWGVFFECVVWPKQGFNPQSTIFRANTLPLNWWCHWSGLKPDDDGKEFLLQAVNRGLNIFVPSCVLHEILKLLRLFDTFKFSTLHFFFKSSL